MADRGEVKLTLLVPAVTPVSAGRPDLVSLGRLFDFGLRAGVDGFLVLGSSGESVALAAEDRLQVAAFAADRLRGRVPFMLGVPTLGTRDAIAEAIQLDQLGPSSLLVAAPAGMALSPSELERHFVAFREAVQTPLVLYEVPSRVGVSLPIDLVAQLGSSGVVVGVKDSSGDQSRARAYSAATADIPGFRRYTGSEHGIAGVLRHGYTGAIPGLSNAFPEFHVRLIAQARLGNWSAVAEIQGYIVALLELYFLPLGEQGFPALFFSAVKETLARRGVLRDAAVTPPLTPADDRVRAHVDLILELAAELRSHLALEAAN